TRRRTAWHYLASELRPDVALLQEAALPGESVLPGTAQLAPGIDEPSRWQTGSRRRWCSVVVSFGLPMREIAFASIGQADQTDQLDASHPGVYRAAEITLPTGRPLYTISLYGL